MSSEIGSDEDFPCSDQIKTLFHQPNSLSKRYKTHLNQQGVKKSADECDASDYTSEESCSQSQSVSHASDHHELLKDIKSAKPQLVSSKSSSSAVKYSNSLDNILAQRAILITEHQAYMDMFDKKHVSI